MSTEEVYFCLGNAKGKQEKALLNSCSLPAADKEMSSVLGGMVDSPLEK